MSDLIMSTLVFGIASLTIASCLLLVSLKRLKRATAALKSEADRERIVNEQRVSHLEDENQRLQQELRVCASNLSAAQSMASMAMQPQAVETDRPDRDLTESIASLITNIYALQGFADLTDRWHDQMKAVINNNKLLKEQLERFELLVKSFDVVAINAAISAAQAGVHGKGFGVVAQFVRELSTKTSVEAAEYTRMIDYNTVITTQTFQQIQASGNMIKTAMFALKSGVDRLQQGAQQG